MTPNKSTRITSPYHDRETYGQTKEGELFWSSVVGWVVNLLNSQSPTSELGEVSLPIETLLNITDTFWNISISTWIIGPIPTSVERFFKKTLISFTNVNKVSEHKRIIFKFLVYFSWKTRGRHMWYETSRESFGTLFHPQNDTESRCLDHHLYKKVF